MNKNRLLVFIVAYHAEETLEWVLDRIPKVVFENFQCEVLVVDDGSHDSTFEVGDGYRLKHPELPITVLKNQFNQGYGGNQKIGYLYAIEQGFDFVALIHGDGQYAPEELPRLLEPLADREAEAVFGSRMMAGTDALRGGMPLYKFLGNRILTFFENRLLGTQLSEFHSGYRIYSVETLKRVPFILNTDDFHCGRRGILDLTHKRLFTRRSLKRLLRDAGFEIVEFRGIPAPFPLVFGNGWIGKFLVWVNSLLILVSKGLFSYQFFVRAEGSPDSKFLLRNAKRSGLA